MYTTEDRRQLNEPRRHCDVTSEELSEIMDLVNRLRMQARSRTAANRTMRVEPQNQLLELIG